MTPPKNTRIETAKRDALAYQQYTALRDPRACAPRTFVNSSQTALYVQPVMRSPRADADANLLVGSLGVHA
jgi:hypothetical protein